MATYSTNEFKSGLKVILDNSPCSIMENEFVKPGKGQAFNRVKLRNLLTGRVLEKTFKSGESIEAADVVDIQMQYLYNDGAELHFMNPTSFEQFAIRTDADFIKEASKWLKEEDMCDVTLYNGQPLIVTPPIFADLVIVETDPGLKGDTATGGSKSAKLETGADIRVPLFIKEGEKVRVDTRNGEYVSRSKE